MRRLLLLPVIVLVTLFVSVPPASASPFVPVFTADGQESATITAGDDVTLAWEAFSPGDSTVDLTSAPAVADFDETGVEDAGSRTVTLTEPGD